MKRIFFLLSLCLAISTFTLNSCKKNPTSSSDDSVSAEDAANISSALNATTDDAANAASTNTSFSGKTTGFEALCGALVTIDTSNAVITLTYNGNDCNSIVKRMGTVSVTLLAYAEGARWKNAGATIQIVYNNLTFTNIISGASYTLNGTHYLTNITGGLAYQIMDGMMSGSVAHKHISDNFKVTFGNGTERTWSARWTRTFTGSGGLSIKTITLAGDTTVNGDNNVAIWGTNRNGDAFESSLIAPIVSNSACGFYHPISGEYTHFIANRTVDILFGVDFGGNPITNGTCPFGYKITYTVNGQSKVKINSYWF